MLRKLDTVYVAVPKAEKAEETLAAAFEGVAEPGMDVPVWGARSRVVRSGEAAFKLLEPVDAGPVQEFIEKWGGGLFGVGFTSDTLDAIETELNELGAPVERDGDRVWFGRTPVGGLYGSVSAPRGNSRSEGLLRQLYEVTNTVKDLREAADFYAKAFGLDKQRFQPIASDKYGYTGMLTLFNPPEQLDRIEVTQTTDVNGAMGRFYKRRGAGLYMCFGEADDFGALRARLDALGVQYALEDVAEGTAEPDVLFIHPKGLHGMFMGVSAKDVAWRWSSGH